MSGIKKVLVVGKNSYLARSMMEYCRTHCNEAYKIEFDAVSAREGSWKLTDLSNYDSVILFAGIAHRKADSSLYYEVNHKLAVEIAKRAKQNLVKQFIYISTIAVFGEKMVPNEIRIIQEPANDYAKSKKMAEDDLRVMEDETFRVAIVRPPMVFGKGCPGNFMRLVHLVERVHIYPAHHNQRSAIYIDNLSAFLQELILKNSRGIFVPQNREYLSSADIARSLKKQGKHVYLIHGCSLFIRIGMAFSRQMRKMFGDYQYPLEASRYVDMNYQNVSTSEAIERSIQ